MNVEKSQKEAGKLAATEEKNAEVIRLYDDASDELLGMLTRRLGSRGEAEEVAQDAFERLCSLSEREDINDLRRYFFTMANRLALNVLRRRKLEVAHIARERQLLEGAISEPITLGPERIVDANESLFQVKAVLMNLPDKTRHIFFLHRFEGYTYPEIAKQLRLSQKAIEYHMNRALSALIEAVYGEHE